MKKLYLYQPKMNEKTKEMLNSMYEFVYEMHKYIFLAMIEKKEKERDKYIEKIIKCNEAIEELYSNNWH